MRSGKALLVMAAVLTLTGCATRPLISSCLTREQYEELKRQEPPLVKGRTEGMKADEALPIAVGSAMRLRAWGQNLLGVVEICAK